MQAGDHRRPCAATGKTAPVQGQALVEFALTVPLVFLVIVTAINFGGFIFAWITVSNAARAGAQYFIQDFDSVGLPVQATATQVTNLIKDDFKSLLNGTSPTIAICTNNNGTVTTLAGDCSTSAPPSDPESPLAVLVSVDVTYTYNALIPVFNFSGLGIHAIFPGLTSSTTIHRRAVMRQD